MCMFVCVVVVVVVVVTDQSFSDSFLRLSIITIISQSHPDLCSSQVLVLTHHTHTYVKH